MSWNKVRYLLKCNFLSSQLFSHINSHSYLPLHKGKWAKRQDIAPWISLLHTKTFQKVLLQTMYITYTYIIIFSEWISIIRTLLLQLAYFHGWQSSSWLLDIHKLFYYHRNSQDHEYLRWAEDVFFNYTLLCQRMSPGQKMTFWPQFLTGILDRGLRNVFSANLHVLICAWNFNSLSYLDFSIPLKLDFFFHCLNLDFYSSAVESSLNPGVFVVIAKLL